MLTLAAVAVVQFMVSLDLPVVNVGLPQIAAGPGFSAMGLTLLNSSRQIGASLGLAVLGTAANYRTGEAVTPEALNDGYALGLTLCAALLVAAVFIAVTVLRRTATPAPAEPSGPPESHPRPADAACLDGER